MITDATYDSAIDLLKEASEAYYNGKEIMSNKDFDDLFDQVKEFEFEEGKVRVDSPTKTVGASAVDSLPKFRHTYPALSLDKTKDIREFQKKFEDGILESGDEDNDGVVLMWKEDGSTVQAYYMEGKLQHLVTRGNGEVGSDITHNASAISGVPITIPEKGEVIVRGEALISYKDFEKINDSLSEDQQYKNPRNLAAASIQMLDPNEVKARKVVVKAFNLVLLNQVPNTDGSFDDRPEQNSFSGRLGILRKLGFDVVEHYVCSVTDLSSTVEKMSAQVSEYPYPVDGLVAAMDNYSYSHLLQGTEHHPHILNGYAFKWSDETANTVLRKIEWSPSRTGLLNPVAVFDPVELEGTTVQRASLHNLSIMRQMRIHIGNRLEVFKSNKIIPYCNKNLDCDSERDYDDEFIRDLIGCCPTCGAFAAVHKSSEGIETVYCPNENCPEKMIGKLAHFCERDCMDIQGMSEETIKKLVDAGFIKEYADFFNLYMKPEVQYIPGFGPQSWNKMCDAAREAKRTTFVKFITALGLPDIGKGQAKTLYKYISENYTILQERFFPEIEQYKPVQLFRMMTLQDFDFSVIDGIGKITSDNITKWSHDHWSSDTPETRVTSILEFIDAPPAAQTESSSISGKSFCITGKLISFSNRQELVAKIESLGGRWVDSVSKNTDYLINNDVASTSGKNKKAKELNIPIISESDFLNMLGGDNL